jgi:phosphate transport system protein
MERHQHQDIDRIRQDILRMGGLVEEMITHSMRALVDRNSDLAIAVIKDDNAVDSLQKQIDEECQTVLALYQPTASDMRFLVSAMKIDTDLERMGDAAVNISQSVLVLNQEPPLKPYVDLPRMTILVNGMVRDALDCFVRRDAKQAVEVCKRDDDVDALYHQLFRELLTYMIEDPRSVTRALHLLLIARNLERVADHSTNIAEDVVYYVEGRDIRHLGDQASEPA